MSAQEACFNMLNMESANAAVAHSRNAIERSHVDVDNGHFVGRTSELCWHVGDIIDHALKAVVALLKINRTTTGFPPTDH